MNKAKTIRRTIVDTRYSYCHGAGGSVRLFLECGHENFRKQSQGVPKTGVCRCKECEGLRDGCVSTRGGVRWTWDAEKQWPKLTVITGINHDPR